MKKLMLLLICGFSVAIAQPMQPNVQSRKSVIKGIIAGQAALMCAVTNLVGVPLACTVIFNELNIANFSAVNKVGAIAALALTGTATYLAGAYVSCSLWLTACEHHSG